MKENKWQKNYPKSPSEGCIKERIVDP